MRPFYLACYAAFNAVSSFILSVLISSVSVFDFGLFDSLGIKVESFSDFYNSVLLDLDLVLLKAVDVYTGLAWRLLFDLYA